MENNEKQIDNFLTELLDLNKHFYNYKPTFKEICNQRLLPFEHTKWTQEDIIAGICRKFNIELNDDVNLQTIDDILYRSLRKQQKEQREKDLNRNFNIVESFSQR